MVIINLKKNNFSNKFVGSTNVVYYLKNNNEKIALPQNLRSAITGWHIILSFMLNYKVRIIMCY